MRARKRFASVIAASPRAYRLWLLDEPAPASAGPSAQNLLIALVGEGQGQEETLRSLEGQGATVLALGGSGLATPNDARQHIDWSGDPWLMPLAAGDVVAPGAIAAYRAATATALQARIIYADDDLLDAKGRRCAPHFKPAWNPELQRHFDYLTGSCIIRASQVELAGSTGVDWAKRLVAKVASGEGAAPIRLPYVLHHRRCRPAPQIPVMLQGPASSLPRVSVIIPTRNRLDLLKVCIEGLARTDYPDLEVIVVDNGSDDPAALAYLAGLDPARYRVLRDPGPFNYSRLNNYAAREATGELLCLLNNDIEMLSSDWLAIMVRQAMRPEVGAVGAQLLYPNGRIQHAGVVMGICGGAAHAHRLLHPDSEGYFYRHALPQFVSAVTAACLIVRRASFEAIGGLDEMNFAVAFNDVDLCMRLNAKGWQSFYEPRAKLIHHESVSRGKDRDPVGAARMRRELAALQTMWHTDREIDPYHHPQLNRFSESFVVRI
ncbi:glycosyltransferase family 2 protein [Novosphingobium lindaniclasticum]|nr:glycosyltransferase family 2 protein [Novosphingobium lindaniclasticum]